MSTTVSGYVGLFRQPYANSATYMDTLYLITDALHQELNLILLTPGAYRDAYRVASQMTYQKIHIFTPSMDALFLSDVFRLVIDLQKIKKSVKWYYPEKIKPVPTNVLFEVAQATSNFYVSQTISGLQISYKLSSTVDPSHRFYDIYVADGSRNLAFCMYMDADKLATMNSCGDFDELHLPYNCTFYGGMTVREVLTTDPAAARKLVANNFKCREEFMEAAHQEIMPPRRVIA